MITEKDFDALIKKAAQLVEPSKKKQARAKSGRYSDKRIHQHRSASNKGKHGGKSRQSRA